MLLPLFLLLAFLSPLLQSHKCSDINALHELKYDHSFKNVIQDYKYLTDNHMIWLTQELQYEQWRESSGLLRTQFTEYNGGIAQFGDVTPLDLSRKFVLLNADQDRMLFAQVSHENQVHLMMHDQTWKAPYPLKIEHIYDEKGQIVDKKEYDAIVLDSISWEASRRQLQMEPLGENDVLMLVFSQGSLKLVRASVSTKPNADQDLDVHYKWSTLVMPKVDGFAIAGSKYDSIMKIYKDQIMVITTIHLDEKAAFEKVHPGFKAELNNMEHAPFILLYSMDGELKSIRRTIGHCYEDQNIAHIGGADLREDTLVLVGNGFPTSGLHFDREATGAYYSVIDLSSDKEEAIFTRALNFLLYGDDADKGFIVRDVVFAPDTMSTDLFFFAGDVQMDRHNLYKVEGRIFFSDGKSSLRQIPVGEGGANIVRRMERHHKESGETVVADMYMDGPMAPPEHPKDPKKDTLRTVKTGMWMVDCSSPNHALEVAAKVGFFSVVGVTMLVFVSCVSAFTVLCVFEIRDKRRAKKKDILEDPELLRLIN